MIEMRWKLGSLGFDDKSAVMARADAAPIAAEVQLHLTFLPMECQLNYHSFRSWDRERERVGIFVGLNWILGVTLQSDVVLDPRQCGQMAVGDRV